MTEADHHRPVLTAEQAGSAVAQRTADMVARLEAAAQAQARLAQVRAQARSTWTEIEAVVSGRGTLLELVLGEAASRLRPQALAAEIVVTVQRACARAAEQTMQVVAELVPADVDLAGAVLDPALTEEPSRPHPPERPDEVPEPDSWLYPSDDRGRQ